MGDLVGAPEVGLVKLKSVFALYLLETSSLHLHKNNQYLIESLFDRIEGCGFVNRP